MRFVLASGDTIVLREDDFISCERTPTSFSYTRPNGKIVMINLSPLLLQQSMNPSYPKPTSTWRAPGRRKNEEEWSLTSISRPIVMKAEENSSACQSFRSTTISSENIRNSLLNPSNIPKIEPVVKAGIQSGGKRVPKEEAYLTREDDKTTLENLSGNKCDTMFRNLKNEITDKIEEVSRHVRELRAKLEDDMETTMSEEKSMQEDILDLTKKLNDLSKRSGNAEFLTNMQYKDITKRLKTVEEKLWFKQQEPGTLKPFTGNLFGKSGTIGAPQE